VASIVDHSASGRQESLPPLPPDELIDRVNPRGVTETTADADREAFRASGQQSVRDIERALAGIGRTLDSFPRILEFGCGCGRIMGWLGPLANRCELFGTDIDEAAIAWCAENLTFARFGVNPHEPPTSYPDASFDLVFNHSVLTHLDERYQDLWLAELKRITKPGGTVLLTVHGELAFEQAETAMAGAGENPASWREPLERDGILFVEQDGYVGSAFPDFYHTTFHAPWYVFEHWGRAFTVRAYLPHADLGHQDIILLERAPDDPPRPRAVRARPGGGAAADQPSAAAGEETPLARVQAELDRGVAPRHPSRFGAPGELVRRALLRVMRPYTAIERSLDRDLADAIADMQRRTDEVHRLASGELRMPLLVQDVLNRHSERMKRLDADLRADLGELAERIERIERDGPRER
jgi:SAM-dependent methyltransferase